MAPFQFNRNIITKYIYFKEHLKKLLRKGQHLLGSVVVAEAWAHYTQRTVAPFAQPQ